MHEIESKSTQENVKYADDEDDKIKYLVSIISSKGNKKKTNYNDRQFKIDEYWFIVN